MEQWILFVLAGIAGGIFSAMFGVGAGIILVPLLAIAFHFPQKSAQGMALAVMVPMALVGAIRYKLNPDITLNMPVIGVIAIGAVIGALVGSEIIKHIPGGVLRKLFAVFMIVVAVKMLISKPQAKKSAEEPSTEKRGEVTPPPKI